jgi:hypothetical protein
MESKNMKYKELYSAKNKLNTTSKTNLSQTEKNKILQKLNHARKEKEIFEKMAKQRIQNKKTYSFHNKLFYKIKNLERDYYLKCEDYQKIMSRPKEISIFYEFLGEIKKKNVLIQIKRYSDKLYISEDLIKTYYKPCYLEGHNTNANQSYHY